jgi:hypothetical protein
MQQRNKKVRSDLERPNAQVGAPMLCLRERKR